MSITSVSVTAKSRSLANGTANDATVPEANFVELYNNDQNIASSLNNVITAVNNLAPLGGMKNLIIGGDFATNPWQRGKSFSNVNGGFIADRFLINITAGAPGTLNVTQSSDVPTLTQANRLITYSLAAHVNTADSALVNHFYALETRIEGCNYLSIAQKFSTLSFWVKSALSGTHSVAFRNAAADESYVAEYTIATANTWQYVTINIPAPPATGTWCYDDGSGSMTNNYGLSIMWSLAASVNTGTAGSWQATNLGASINQVNLMASTSNFFQLALIQLESGNAATAFENRSIQDEMLLCQRYFNIIHGGVIGTSTGSQAWSFTNNFPTMRVKPSVGYTAQTVGSSNYGTTTIQDLTTNSLTTSQVLGNGNGSIINIITLSAEI